MWVEDVRSEDGARRESCGARTDCVYFAALAWPCRVSNNLITNSPPK